MSRRHKKARRKPRHLSAGVISIAVKGYGFVDTPEGEYFVLRGHLRGAMDGDVVEVQRLRKLEAQRRQYMQRPSAQQLRYGSGEGDRELLGSVTRVLERAHSTVVGTMHFANGLGVVVPHDERIQYDIFLDRRAEGLIAKDGDVVVVRLTAYPGRIQSAQGYIEEILGRQDEQGMGIEVIIRQHALETQFSAAALAEAEQAAAPTAPAQAAAGALPRRDLRQRCIFTVDPEDARDFDDALSLDYVDGQLRLGVHIADVSAYVPWDSAIDMDARRRATSVYLPDRVLPMLPPRLSDELCSLRPGEDKLAFTVDMLLAKDGSVLSSEFYPSLICSRARLTYDEALEIITGGSSIEPPCAAEVAERLCNLDRLATRLEQRRRQRGAIDFAGVEAKVLLDADGAPVEVRLRSKTRATALVEEAMILANEQVAAWMLQQEAAMVFRVHDHPAPGALEELLPTLQEFGYCRQGPPTNSHEIQQLLDESAGRPEHYLISSLLLRAMKRACYAPKFSTHFGLASTAYCHFTSPIRRYPDLMVHRLLKEALGKSQMEAGALSEPQVQPGSQARPGPAKLAKSKPSKQPKPPAWLSSTQGQLDWICQHSSNMEREAERAAFEATALKLVEYLAPRIGEHFTGIITGVNTYGLYVREDSTTADGFVAAASLPGDFEYEMARQRYRDPTSGQAFRLGQPVDVILKDIDNSRHQLLFVIQ
ncbi:MAG: VacB/RNase II family 3'-5' exoribonuclease [Coriobacteriales bacterium]|jgi:ribonuclease R|nr:VacB/RNase II family 3'-5' exoribonuclease [Coriobacteriales bacterium]